MSSHRSETLAGHGHDHAHDRSVQEDTADLILGLSAPEEDDFLDLEVPDLQGDSVGLCQDQSAQEDSEDPFPDLLLQSGFPENVLDQTAPTG